MKKIFFLLLTLFLAICCEPENDSPATGQDNITISSHNLSFEAEEGTQVLSLEASGDWTISKTADWCNVSPAKGTEGISEISISVTANNTDENRECILTVLCGKAQASITITQFAPIGVHTPYVDLKFDDTANTILTGFNEESGTISITYTDPSMIPDVEKNKVIVLPESEDYQSMIRIVKDSHISGNCLTLETEPGTMSNLFENIEFALTTNPSMTLDESFNVTSRSGNPLRIITPDRMVIKTNNGKDIILFDRNDPTRTEISGNFNLFQFEENYKGQNIFNNDHGRLFWEECYFNFSINSFIYFAYGNDYLSSDNIWGFQYYIEGDMNINLLLKYIIEIGFEEEIDDIVINDALRLGATFTVGGVPVNVEIIADIRSYLALEANTKLSASAGFSYNYNFGRIGMNWMQGGTPTQILKLGKPSYSLHEPTLTLQGGLSAWGGFYPNIYVQFYKLAGPWISLLPYLNFEMEAALKTTASGNDDYMGWTMDFGAGLAYNLGLDWAFRTADKEPWSPYDGPKQIDNLYTTLYEAPVKIELVSPNTYTDVSAGRPLEVVFRVSSESPLFPESDFNCPNAVILFSSESDGDLSNDIAVTDVNGTGKVTWTPKDSNDKLIARIVDSEGEDISRAEFAPEINAFKVTLVSHKDGDGVEADAPVTVRFQVDSIKADSTCSPAEGIQVDFSNESSMSSDKNGIVETEWIPTEEKPQLTASINMPGTDKEGNPVTICLSADTFTPKLIRTDIVLSSPEDGHQIKSGDSIEVAFRVMYSSAEESNIPCEGRKVQFEDGTGWTEISETASDGTVNVSWTPQDSEPVLTAHLLNENGDIIRSATFTPVIIMNRIRLESPDEKKEIVENQEITVRFLTYEHPVGTPIKGTSVNFYQTGDGTLSTTSGITDANGFVTVIWSPSKNAALTAVLNENGDSATYTPTFVEPTLVGKWNCVAYKEEPGEPWYKFPEGMMWIEFGEDGGYWKTAYNYPGESWYESGIAWRQENNMLYFTGNDGVEFAYTQIVFFDGITLEITPGEGEYFRFERAEEDDDKSGVNGVTQTTAHPSIYPGKILKKLSL